LNVLSPTEAWIATVPEPGTALLVGVGVLGMAQRRSLTRWGRSSVSTLTRPLRVGQDRPELKAAAPLS
jgi:hypothetical protein